MAKIVKNITKMVITSVVCNSHAMFGLKIGFVLSGNSSVTFPYVHPKKTFLIARV